MSTSPHSQQAPRKKRNPRAKRNGPHQESLLRADVDADPDPAAEIRQLFTGALREAQDVVTLLGQLTGDRLLAEEDVDLTATTTTPPRTPSALRTPPPPI